MDELKSIIVIGASAGGLKAITELVSKIPEKLPVAIMVVMHMSKQSLPEVVQQQLQKHTSFICKVPLTSENIQIGHLYIAPPDNHLLITRGTVHVTKGPHENRWRPSIDVLFRSAAASYNSHVIGIVLTGMLDDGTSGMWAIKRSGGTCIVQEPEEAEFPDMPNSVLDNVEVDYRVSINDIGYILDDLLSKPAGPVHEIPEDIRIEAEITEKRMSSIENLAKISEPSNYTCPQCGGGLWAVKNDNAHRYRCHTGHTFNEKVLVEMQAESIEESVWVSIRMLEERRNLLQTVARHAHEKGMLISEEQNLKKADDIVVHIERLKMLLSSLNKNGDIAQNDEV